MNLQYRIAEKSEWPVLYGLWNQAFGDKKEFVEKVFQQFVGPQGVYVAVQEEEPVALLCAVPVTLQNHSGAYFYGLCTRMDQRGKGIMHGLIEYVCGLLRRQGSDFACLIPAGPELFGFYAEQGFEKAFAKRILSVPIRHNLWAQAEFDNITAKALTQLRRQYVPNSVQLNDQSMAAVLGDLYSGGVTTVNTDAAYGLYFVKGEQLRFTELFAKSDRDAELIIQAAREKERAEVAQIALGTAQELFMGTGEVKDYGMIRFLDVPFDVSDSYMRLMLDEIY